MKIWIVTTSDYEGVASVPFNDKNRAHHEAHGWCKIRWDMEFPNDRMPDDWQTAFNMMVDKPGFTDFISVREHDVSPKIPSDTEQSFIAKAREMYHRDGEIEIDDYTVVSHGADPGVYVQAWVWVPEDELSDTDLLMRYGYRITPADVFIKEAPREVIEEVVCGAGGLDNMVLWTDEPEAFRLTMPTYDECMEIFKEHLKGI